MMSDKAAAAVIRAPLAIFNGILVAFVSWTLLAVDCQPKVVFLLGVRQIQRM